MKNIIMRTLANYKELASTLDVSQFTNDVCNSFINAKSSKHYVILVPVDLDDTFNDEQHKSFEKHGYFQAVIPDRFNNMFFACQEVVNQMADTLLSDEGMAIDIAQDPSGEKVTVVSLEGMDKTHFYRDFKNPQEKAPIMG